MAKFAKGQPRHEAAGRKKGTPNKRTQSLIEKCEAKGIDLFESMLEIAIEMKEPTKKFDMMERISQYVYPKRKAIEHSVDPKIAEAAEEFKELTREEKIQLYKEEIKKLEGN